MTDMKGLTCHIAFDLLSLEQDKRGAKCQVIQVTHPHTRISTQRGKGRLMFYNKTSNPPAILHSKFCSVKSTLKELNLTLCPSVYGPYLNWC